MADVKVNELAAETNSSLNGAESFVMFDAAEGKRCTVTEMMKYVRAKQGSMERKNIRCNATAASTDKAGFQYKQEVTWANMTANDFVDGWISAGTYSGVWAIESAADKVILWFAIQPATSVYVNVYREVTTTV